MPLNCDPADDDGARRFGARSARRRRAGCRVDVGFWGGLVPGNAAELARRCRGGRLRLQVLPLGLGRSGVRPRSASRSSNPRWPRSRGSTLRCSCTPSRPATRSRPAGAATASLCRVISRRAPPPPRARPIARVLSLCRGDRAARVHILHLSSARGPRRLDRAGEARRAAGDRRDLPALPALRGRGDRRRSDGVQVRAAHPRSARTASGCGRRLPPATLDMVVVGSLPGAAGAQDEGHRTTSRARGAASPRSAWRSSVAWTEARRRGSHVADLARWMSAGPAARLAWLRGRASIAAGQRRGFRRLRPGGTSGRSTPDRLRHRHKLTPYAGRRLTASSKRRT